MNVILNGERVSFESVVTVRDLLAKLELAPLRVAVEVNEGLVRRATFDEHALRDGDRVEIVTLVGGG